MKAALALCLALLSPLSRAAAPEVSTGTAPLAHEESTEAGPTPYAQRNFETDTKADLKQLEADLKETLALLNASFSSEKDLETRQYKQKLAFLQSTHDQSVAFEKNEVAEWKKFVEKLSALEPADRGAAKLAFDQKSTDARISRNNEAQAKTKEFLTAQNREREAYWENQQRIQQRVSSERARVRAENSTKWSKPSDTR